MAGWWSALGFITVVSSSIDVHAAGYPPTAGTDRESTAYLDAVEQYLTSLDLDAPALVYSQLGGTTATNWAVKKDGIRVADLKCTSGNTNHHGAVVTYRLGRELDFNIYPVSVYRDVNRRIGNRTVNEQCALKEWTSVFTQYYWTRDTFADTDSRDKRSLIGALDCGNSQPGADEPFEYSALSSHGHPSEGRGRTPYRGTTTLLDAARDFSNMMVIDALIGNEDRFPGGNTFFRSVSTSYDEKDGAIVFDDVRLFSLDNEAAFKGRGPASTYAARDLERYLSRFDGRIMERLESLSKDSATLERIAGGDASRIAFMREGIEIVLERYAAATARCGDDAARFASE